MASTRQLGEVDKGVNRCSGKFKGEEEEEEEKETKTHSCRSLWIYRREKDELIKGIKDDDERGMRMHTNGLLFKKEK